MRLGVLGVIPLLMCSARRWVRYQEESPGQGMMVGWLIRSWRSGSGGASGKRQSGKGWAGGCNISAMWRHAAEGLYAPEASVDGYQAGKARSGGTQMRSDWTW